MEAQTNARAGSRDQRARKQHFVLAQGNVSVDVVVERATAKGIQLSRSYVYGIRSTSKNVRADVEKRSVAFRDDAPERRFLDCVIELGIQRSAELLARCRAAATSVV